MQIALCDDNYIQVRSIEDYLRAQGIDVDFYDSGEALVRAYRDGAQRYDAVFLDIEMQPVGGFETADTIYAIDDSVLIVFVTSHHEYVEEWFKFSGVWFLHKPVEEPALAEAFAYLQKTLAKRCRTYTFSDSHQNVRLRCDSILYLEARDHNVVIHTKDGQTYTIRKSLKELEQELSEGFCRVHASYMVNLQHLVFMGRDRESGKDIVRLDHSSDSIPIGRAYKQSASAAFLKFKEESFGV